MTKGKCECSASSLHGSDANADLSRANLTCLTHLCCKVWQCTLTYRTSQLHGLTTVNPCVPFCVSPKKVCFSSIHSTYACARLPPARSTIHVVCGSNLCDAPAVLGWRRSCYRYRHWRSGRTSSKTPQSIAAAMWKLAMESWPPPMKGHPNVKKCTTANML